MIASGALELKGFDPVPAPCRSEVRAPGVVEVSLLQPFEAPLPPIL